MEKSADIKNIPHVRRFLNWSAVMLSADQARYYAAQLVAFKKEASMEAFYELDGIMAAFVMAYGRMFVGARDVARLDDNIYKGTKFEKVHERLVELRHARYAHHGIHEYVEHTVEVYMKAGDIVVKSGTNLTIPGIDFETWLEIVEFARAYIFEKTDGFLKRASEHVGVTVRLPKEDEQPDVRIERKNIGPAEWKRITGRDA